MAKYCSSCNTLSEDDSIKFCPACGGNEFYPAQAAPEVPFDQNDAYTQPQDFAEQPNVAEPQVQADPALDSFYGQTPEFVAGETTGFEPGTEPVGKPKKKRLLKRLIIGGVAIAAAVAVALSPIPSFVAGYAIKIFGSDEQYMAFVENKALKQYTDSFVNWYENYLKGIAKRDVSLDTEIGIKLGELPKTLLAARTGMKASEMDWIEDTKLRYSTNLKGDEMSYDVGLKVGDIDILSAMATLDMSDQVVLLGMKELTDDVLQIDIGEMESELGLLFNDDTTAILEALPDGKMIRKLANKYFKIFTKNFKNASMSDEQFEVGDISQKLTVIEVDVNEKFILNAAAAVLKEAEKDKDIKSIIKDIEKAAEKSGLMFGDTNLYSEFKSAVSNMRDDIDEQLDVLDGSGRTLCTWYDYVDWTHDIVGHKIEDGDGDTLVEYVELKKGSKVEVEGNIPRVVSITGSGTEKSGKRNMSCELNIAGSGKVTVKLEDYKINDAKKGKLEGTVRILPDLESFNIDTSDLLNTDLPVLSSLEPELKVSFKMDGKSQSLDIDLLNGGSLIAGITVDSKMSGGKSVSDPSGERYNAKSEEDIRKFLSKLDMDSLLQNLKKAGLPGSVLDPIEDLLGNYTKLIENAGNSYRDYDDDEDYEDYEGYEGYEEVEEAEDYEDVEDYVDF